MYLKVTFDLETPCGVQHSQYGVELDNLIEKEVPVKDALGEMWLNCLLDSVVNVLEKTIDEMPDTEEPDDAYTEGEGEPGILDKLKEFLSK